MHDGSNATLEDVMNFYDGGAKPNLRLDREIHRLGLSSSEKRDLVAFSLRGGLDLHVYEAVKADALRVAASRRSVPEVSRRPAAYFDRSRRY
jgi:hypothetical protein